MIVPKICKRARTCLHFEKCFFSYHHTGIGVPYRILLLSFVFFARSSRVVNERGPNKRRRKHRRSIAYRYHPGTFSEIIIVIFFPSFVNYHRPHTSHSPRTSVNQERLVSILFPYITRHTREP